MSETVGTPERRTGADRRADGDGGRREPKKGASTLSYVLRSLALVAVLLFVIIFAVRHTRPVYATRGTVAEELRKHAPKTAEVFAPVESSTVARLLASP